jgi:GNAT superfamily N-acetyltransferase
MSLEFVLYNETVVNYYDEFLEMLSEYFDEIFSDKPEENIPKKYLPKIINIIIDESKKCPLWVYLCIHNNKVIGFVIAQIDTKENVLCKREGWGFIREFYITQHCRRKGYASQMCKFIENVVYANGAKDIYLTANRNTGEPFWESMEYIYSGITDEKNGNKIYEKFYKKSF